MSQSQRQERLRLLVKKLNQKRKQQARQVDILCNDLIDANRSFVKRLDGVSFAANFYKALLGATTLRILLKQAASLIEQEVPGATVAFFLRHNSACVFYPLNGRDGPRFGSQLLEECFANGVADAVCKSNRCCAIDDMLGMGLEGRPKELRELSAATFPLNDLGRPLGFILLYRHRPRQLSGEELHKVSLVTCGLSHAICRCRSAVPIAL